MTTSLTRFLAATATFVGLLAGGFEAHLAPQTDGWWYGVTGSPSLIRAAIALLTGLVVWRLGGSISVRPFWGMAVGLLSFVPATTGFGSALLFFSGYTMVLLFAVFLGATTRHLISTMPGMEPLAVTLIAFAFFILVGRYLPGPAGPQGDEPHYLLIAESLLRDGDVDLKNQFEGRAYSNFTGANFEPHTAPRSPKGKLYALHTPGLAAMVAPGYALFGFAGARAVVSGAMAVVVGLLYASSKSLFGTSVAGFVFLLATFASPLPVYANSVYPDSMATLPVAAVLAWVASPRPALFGFASAAIATLPWLHPRFLPLALVLALSLSVRGGFTIRRAVTAFVPLIISLGLLLLHFQTLFGSASLSAAYGPGFASDVSPVRIPWGASALILDRQFGLLLFCPVLILGLKGAHDLWNRERAMAMLAVAIFGVLLGVGGSFSMWWGGASAPSRFLIGAMPALLLLCGARWHGAASAPGGRWLLGAASGFGLGLLWLACLAPRALHNRSDGESGLLRLLSPVLDVDRFFPGFVSQSARWLALAWAVALISAVIRPRLGLLAGALLVSFVAVTPSRPLLDPFSSSLRALESWRDERRTFGGQDAESAFALDVPLGGSPWDLTPGAQRYSPRFSLPEGFWTLRVDSQGEGGPGALNLARLSLVGSDENEVALAAVTIKAGETVAMADFELKRFQQRVNIRGDGLQSRARVLSVRLTPRTNSP